MTTIPYDDNNPEHQHPQVAISQWQSDNDLVGDEREEDWINKSTDTTLFIGGTADGQRYAIDSNHMTVRMPLPEKGEQLYRRELLGAPGKTWNIYVVEGMSVQEAMDRLVKNYRPEHI